MSYNVTQNERIKAAKEYAYEMQNASLFDPFLDGCAWLMKQLAGRQAISLDGTKLEICDGHVVYDVFQKFKEQVVYSLENGDSEAKRLYKEKEDARLALVEAERRLREYYQSLEINPLDLHV